jgi:hypothetical protein
MPAQLIKPDSKDQTISKDITVFLAGTIDNVDIHPSLKEGVDVK